MSGDVGRGRDRLEVGELVGGSSRGEVEGVVDRQLEEKLCTTPTEFFLRVDVNCNYYQIRNRPINHHFGVLYFK